MKKRIAAIFLVLMLLIMMAPDAVGYGAGIAAPQFYVTTVNLHLREAPNTDADSLGVLPRGTAVQLLRRHNENWLEVAVTNAQTIHHEWIAHQTGYMAAEFLVPTYQACFTGEVTWLIEPTWDFDAVFPFHEGMAGVEIFEDYGWMHILGYINNRGEIVIPLQYRHRQEHYTYSGAPSFTYGRVILWSEDNSSVAVFDNEGNIIVPFEFTNGWGFSEGLAAVQTGTFTMTDDGWVDTRQWGFIDLEGNVVIDFQFSPFSYEFRPAHNPRFSEGLAAVHHMAASYYSWQRMGYWGFIDPTGHLIIPFTYDYARDFREGRAAVVMGDWEWSDNATWGFIDHEGNMVIPMQYSHVSDFSEGRAIVRYGGWDNISVIDRYDNTIVPFGQFEDAGSFSEGLAAVRVGDWRYGQWGFIDREGNEVVPLGYNYARSFSEGLAVVASHGRVVDGSHDRTERLQWNWGVIDREGNEVVPLIYDHVRNFSHGLAAVLYGDLWGLIDREGNVVVPIQFDDIRSFSEGLAWARQGDLWGILQIGGGGTPVVPIYIMADAAPATVLNYEPISDHLLFTPNPQILAYMTCLDTAQEQIRAVMQGFTPDQRNSADALNIAALFVEQAQRRGTSQELPEDGNITADIINMGYERAQQLRQAVNDILAAENIGLQRSLRTNINFVSQQTDEFSFTFPGSTASIPFDRITVESGFAAITFDRINIPFGSRVSVRLLDGGEETGISVSTENASRQVTIIDFWSVPVILLVVAAAIMLARRGKRLPIWAAPAIILLMVVINAATIILQSDDVIIATPENIQMTYPVSVYVSMPQETRITLSLPVHGTDNPRDLILFDIYDRPQISRFNPVTNMVDSTITTGGTYILRHRCITEFGFLDIDDKPQMMQEAITRLAARDIYLGWLGVHDDHFSPDSYITRIDFTITRSMVLNIPSFDFRAVERPNDHITMEEVEELVKGALVHFLDYTTPPDIFYMTNPAPQSHITRGDAAIILYRLFNRAW